MHLSVPISHLFYHSIFFCACVIFKPFLFFFSFCYPSGFSDHSTGVTGIDLWPCDTRSDYYILGPDVATLNTSSALCYLDIRQSRGCMFLLFRTILFGAQSLLALCLVRLGTIHMFCWRFNFSHLHCTSVSCITRQTIYLYTISLT